MVLAAVDERCEGEGRSLAHWVVVVEWKGSLCQDCYHVGKDRQTTEGTPQRARHGSLVGLSQTVGVKVAGLVG